MFRQTKRRTLGRRNFEDSKGSHIYAGNASMKNKELLETIYSNRLSFYSVPPFEEITLDEFEKWALDRLKVLIEIESSHLRNKTMKELESSIKPILEKHLPLSTNTKDLNQLVAERRKDHYSHYILRLAFCRSEDLRNRFVRAESTLFKLRYKMLSSQEQKQFINGLHLPWEAVNEEEKQTHFEQLLAACTVPIRGILSQETNVVVTNESVRAFCAKEQFLKVPFEFIPDLVSSHSIFMHKGFGYVPQFQQLSLIANQFVSQLTESLQITVRSIPKLDEDDRLLPVLNHISKGYIANEYQSNFKDGDADVGDINAETVQSKSVSQHYPLCMSHLMKGLNQEHHLKYLGRQQLSLFLKGIGLSVDEALKFWSFNFTKGPMNLEQFNKEYRYNFRHNYGLEGGRINYKPWDCHQILSKASPSRDEYHGCPYRDLTSEKLTMELNKMGITDQYDVNTIVDNSSRGDYTNACTKVFELTHKKEIEIATQKTKFDLSLITHPNLYFDRSRKLAKVVEETS
ncbi:BA75_02660T0 [Komagataella pastoris]|uniref:DNA primase large subunit n=1 Tax=Komagataella pastoris TaxID=4922 RepID=A0A1B2JD44_PICPA|nr:BA75_02660T0 [Komagataella pastoris]